jgi:hypothetical protein
MQEQPYDLFGEVRVTQDDVRLWLLAVPRIDPDGPRAAHYVRSYDVAGKIARAKLDGVFDLVTAPRMIIPGSPLWWARMCWG